MLFDSALALESPVAVTIMMMMLVMMMMVVVMMMVVTGRKVHSVRCKSPPTPKAKLLWMTSHSGPGVDSCKGSSS